MKERKNIFKRIGYLLMILTLTIVVFVTPRFLEKEVNASTDIKLSTVTIKSDNNNSAFAKVGDTITVNIIASENIQTPKVKIAGQGAIVKGNGNIYTATYLVGTEIIPEGKVGISISYLDLFGNYGEIVSATTNSSTVTIDTRSPILSTVIVSDNIKDPTLAILGDKIIVSVKALEDIQTPTIKIAGEYVTVTRRGDTYTGTYQVTSDTPLGRVLIATTCYDMAGNERINVLWSEVIVDYDVLFQLDVLVASNNDKSAFAKVGDTITISYTASEDIYPELIQIAGKKATITGSGKTYTGTYIVTSSTREGKASIGISYENSAGNSFWDGKVSQLTIDTTAPIIKPIYGAVLNKADISTWTAPTAVATDNIDGDRDDLIVVTYYKADGTTEIELDAARTELTAERDVVVKYNLSDITGNVAEEVSATFTIIDKEAPVIKVEGYELNNGEIEILIEKENALIWTAPTATVVDNIDTGLTAEVSYFTIIYGYSQLIDLAIARIELAAGRNIEIVYKASDAAGNEASLFGYVYSDSKAPVIEPVDGATVITEEASSWTAPKAIANDHTGVDISDRVVVTYFKADGTTSLANLTAARTELVEGRNVVVKYNVSDEAGNQATEVSATFRARTLGTPTITRGNWILEGSNWTLAQQYVFTTNEPIVEYSLDGGKFVAITPSFKGEYTIYIGDNLPHRLLLKSVEGDVGDTFPIQAKTTGNDNLMFYASKGLLPWDSDANWQFNGAGAITPDIFDEDGNCKQEYGNGAACYKIYELDVAGEQVKVLQQLDDSSTAILQTVRLLDKDDYNNLYSNGGVVRGRVIVPAQNTYAGNFQEGYGAFVGLQFEAEMITGSSSNRRYGLNITYSGEYVEIATVDGSVILNGNAGVPAIGISRTVKAPKVKAGDSFDFVIHIPKTAGAIGKLPKAEIYINKTFVGKTNFNTFGGGSKGNKVIISSGSTGGTNRAILIENFGSVINTGAYDVSVPISGGASVVNDSIYTFESDERLTGYQVNYEKWVFVEPTFKITDIHLKNEQNDIRVCDRSGNIATYTVYYFAEENPYEEDFEPAPYIPITTVDFPQINQK